MSISKKGLAVISWIAHLVIALILCNIVASIIARIVLLVSIGVIGGIQSVCIKSVPEDKK